MKQILLKKAIFLIIEKKENGRVPTPSIEIGSATNRYRHIAIVNLARTTSLYGEHMRTMFGPGKGKYQQAFDFSSLEARIQGHYCYNYTQGKKFTEKCFLQKNLMIGIVLQLLH